MTSLALPHKSIDALARADNPKKAIQDAIGNLDGVEIIGDMVLIGIYIRPEKTKGGIIRPQSNVTEDVYQGKVGLVLKWGPDAFFDPNSGDLFEQRVNPGEWCVFKVGDAWNVTIKDVPCRLVRDSAIKMKLQDPDSVF